MQFLQLLRLMLTLLPLIKDAIIMAEQMFQGDGKGSEKLAFVKGLISLAYQRGTDTLDDFEELWPALENQINLIVNTYNSLGLFRKGDVED